ncbi:hypothetical protein HCUR_01290 [Holospora curviuscula]|uniref:Uncharacterized protein n=1 Tax=Holospora curviuscula TaxID=1082868 RepID=A0A2S5R7F0_9PROT|nr:hypothetical protein HCUR_01290 [Holospora curviuscula]
MNKKIYFLSVIWINIVHEKLQLDHTMKGRSTTRNLEKRVHAHYMQVNTMKIIIKYLKAQNK